MNVEDEAPTVFTGELSQHLKCPVCQRLYAEPVINVQCGHTFCQACAHASTQCPADGRPCDRNQLVVNRLVVGQINDLLIYCRYGVTKEDGQYVPDRSGCQEQIPLGNRASHESQCKFLPVQCPNLNNSCGTFRQSELEEHLRVCIFTPCEHRVKGCEFKGRVEEVNEHEKNCGYRGLQKSINMHEFQEISRSFEEKNAGLKGEVVVLSQRVENLEQEKTSLNMQLTQCTRSLQDLQQKYDSLASTVEQLMSRNRRLVSSPAHSTEATRPSSSSSFRRSRNPDSPSATVKSETWRMPFQFKCLGTLRGHKDAVWCLKTHGKKLYSAGSDCTIKVWDLANLERGCIKTIQGHSGEIQSIATDGNMMFTGGHDNSIRVWDLETTSELHVQQNAHDNIISTMVTVGQYLFTASFSLIKVWEAKTLTLKHTITGLHHWVRALALDPDREKLFSGSHNTIDIWDVVEPFGLKGKVEHTFGSVYSLVITAKYIIAGTYNQNIQIFNAHTYQNERQLMGHIGTIYGLVASPSGRFLFSASLDHAVQVWNLENMLPIQTLQRHVGSVNTLLLYGDFLFSGSEDREIKVFKYSQMQMGFAPDT